MKLKRDAKTLKSKSIASLTRGLNIFNNSEENGRHETVLLLLQHSSEMLLKSLLIQKGENVFDKQRGISIGLNKALQTALNKSWITEGQAGAIRTLDAMRDQAQHWMLVSSEELLYINSRALITAIDGILTKHFDDTLADNLPLRVLPISTTPVTDINILLDKEFTQIKELLSPNRRARDEARGRIAALLAMEAHSGQEVQISKKRHRQNRKGHTRRSGTRHNIPKTHPPISNHYRRGTNHKDSNQEKRSNSARSQIYTQRQPRTCRSRSRG